MKSTRKFSKVLSLALALVLALALFPTAVFAANDGSITVYAPNGMTLTSGTVNAYQVLQADEDGDPDLYVPTANWEDFFANITGDVKEEDYIYYDAATKSLKTDTTDPGKEGAFQLQIEDVNQTTLDAKHPAQDFLYQIKDAGQLTTLAGWMASYIMDKPVSPPTATGAFTNTASVTLDPATLTAGYYIITATNLMDGQSPVNTTNDILIELDEDAATGEVEDVNVTLKATPKIDKTVVGGDTDVQVGDSVQYSITLPLPQNTTLTSIESAVLKDMLQNLSYDVTSFELTAYVGDAVDGTPYTGDALKNLFTDFDNAFTEYSKTQLTLEVGQTEYKYNQKFELTFSTAGLTMLNELADNPNAKVVLTYSATVMKEAAAANGGENDALFYLNDPNAKSEPYTDDTTVKTYNVELKKTFEDPTTDLAALYGAVKFKLYEVNANDGSKTLINVVKTNDDGVYLVATDDDSKIYVLGGEMSLDTDTGKLTIKGLDTAQEYYLEETATAENYAQADAKFTINAVTAGTVDANTSTVTLTNGVDAGKDANENTLTFNMLNRSDDSFTLPSTGGAGTWMFTLGGLALIAIAGTALYVSKKKVTE